MFIVHSIIFILVFKVVQIASDCPVCVGTCSPTKLEQSIKYPLVRIDKIDYHSIINDQSLDDCTYEEVHDFLDFTDIELLNSLESEQFICAFICPIGACYENANDNNTYDCYQHNSLITSALFAFNREQTVFIGINSFYFPTSLHSLYSTVEKVGGAYGRPWIYEENELNRSDALINMSCVNYANVIPLCNDIIIADATLDSIGLNAIANLIYRSVNGRYQVELTCASYDGGYDAVALARNHYNNNPKFIQSTKYSGTYKLTIMFYCSNGIYQSYQPVTGRADVFYCTRMPVTAPNDLCTTTLTMIMPITGKPSDLGAKFGGSLMMKPIVIDHDTCHILTMSCATTKNGYRPMLYAIGNKHDVYTFVSGPFAGNDTSPAIVSFYFSEYFKDWHNLFLHYTSLKIYCILQSIDGCPHCGHLSTGVGLRGYGQDAAYGVLYEMRAGKCEATITCFTSSLAGYYPTIFTIQPATSEIIHLNGTNSTIDRVSFTFQCAKANPYAYISQSPNTKNAVVYCRQFQDFLEGANCSDACGDLKLDDADRSGYNLTPAVSSVTYATTVNSCRRATLVCRPTSRHAISGISVSTGFFVFGSLTNPATFTFTCDANNNYSFIYSNQIVVPFCGQLTNVVGDN